MNFETKPVPCILKIFVARSFRERIILAFLAYRALAEVARYEV